MINSILDTIISRYAPAEPLDETGLQLHQAPDLFALWAALEEWKGTICPPPFWGIVWPANRMLAHHLMSNPDLARNRSVLDIGCGGGAAAVAAAMCGASCVCANDIDSDALYATHVNATRNGTRVTTDASNILNAATERVWDVILVADMFYEASLASSFFTYLLSQKKHGSQVLIADANRPFTPVHQLNKISAASFSTNPDIDGVSQRTVTLYELP